MATASAPTAPQTSQPGSELRVFLLTLGPGDAAWEKFGHNALMIRDESAGTDVAYNWGIFQFDNWFFVNFIRGKLWYWMEGEDAARMIQWYVQAQDRSVWLQELNLSPAQRLALRDFCQWNARPENRRYKYDYYIDNCSTRVRDALDRVLDGQIRRAAQQIPSPITYRSETRRLMADDPILYTAVYFILGQRIDRKLTAWDEMFIPMRMKDRFNELRVLDEQGNERPLVKREMLLHTSRRSPPRQDPPNWIGWFMLVGTAWGGVMIACSLAVARWSGARPQAGRRRGAWAKWGLGASAGLWSFLCGFAGCFLLYGWFLTDHTWTRDNENLLQLNPLLLPLVVLVPMQLRGRGHAGRAAVALAAAALTGSLVGMMLQALPMMNQVNGEIIALALPANAGLAAALLILRKHSGINVGETTTELTGAGSIRRTKGTSS
ncbi:DUF4105 domain-containing protein [Fontivita pretiosa]|uniref:Lnb N-terminal periplasmic domain-containing protein n=1 Tax=Fontivita pretiosa TaxID=2989684 RepID=UPI003D174F6D